MYCTHCGKQTRPDEKLCPHCGLPINGSAGESQPPAQKPSGSPVSGGLTIRNMLIGTAAGLLLTALCAPLVLYARSRVLQSPLNPEKPPAVEVSVSDSLQPILEETQPETAADQPAAEIQSEPTLTESAPDKTATPETLWVELLEGNALEFSQPPDLIAYANNQEVTPPEGVQLAPFCQDSCFRFHQWLGLTMPGESYDVIYSGTTNTLGVQLWGDPGDGIAHVYVDGNLVWEGDTEGTDTNYPGGAFVKYLQIHNLPAIPNHILRIETDATGGGVTIYFFGFSPAVP
ncbi:MAG: zinc-ribbon domain-containing protein [Anaerolineales bacterium]|nr:zinc-ribbon domain-containing protein [Anaerolineales bacterium]